MRRVVYSANPPLDGTIPYGGIGTKIKKAPKVNVRIKNSRARVSINNKPIIGSKPAQKKKPHISFGT